MSSSTNQNTNARSMNGVISLEDGGGTEITDGTITTNHLEVLGDIAVNNISVNNEITADIFSLSFPDSSSKFNIDDVMSISKSTISLNPYISLNGSVIVGGVLNIQDPYNQIYVVGDNNLIYDANKNVNSKHTFNVQGTTIATIDKNGVTIPSGKYLKSPTITLGTSDLQGLLNLKANYSLVSNVDNTSDLNKPISTATQTALNLKANYSLVSNVDNTSDLNKPISTATQNALNLKAPTNNPTFTGDVIVGDILYFTVGDGYISYNYTSGQMTFDSLTEYIFLIDSSPVLNITDSGSGVTIPTLTSTTQAVTDVTNKVATTQFVNNRMRIKTVILTATNSFIGVPTDTLKVDILLFGSGGRRGTNVLWLEPFTMIQWYNSGGSGAGGQIVNLQDILVQGGDMLSLTVNDNTATDKFTSISLQGYAEIARAYNGGDGGAGSSVSRAGGTAGIASTVTTGLTNTNYVWSTLYKLGENGIAGTSTDPNPPPLVKGGRAGTYGVTGNRYNRIGSGEDVPAGFLSNSNYVTGGAIITFYLKSELSYPVV